MQRATKYGLKKLFISFLFVTFASHFMFSNFVTVVPKNFHIIFNRTSNSETNLTCANNDVTNQEVNKGFPLSLDIPKEECEGSNEWLLAGFLNVVYFLSGTLIFGLFRFNILE